MDELKATRKNKSKSGASDGDGQAGPHSATGTVSHREGEAVRKGLDWLTFEEKLLKIEHERNTEGRIVKVWHPEAPPMFVGLYGSAPIEIDEPKFQWSHGGFEEP